MDSPFLVFDLIARNAGFEVKHDPRNLIHQERDHRKIAVGFVGREESQSGSGGNASPNSTGRIRVILRARISDWLYAIARIDWSGSVRLRRCHRRLAAVRKANGSPNARTGSGLGRRLCSLDPIRCRNRTGTPTRKLPIFTAVALKRGLRDIGSA